MSSLAERYWSSCPKYSVPVEVKSVLKECTRFANRLSQLSMDQSVSLYFDLSSIKISGIDLAFILKKWTFLKFDYDVLKHEICMLFGYMVFTFSSYLQQQL